MNGLQDPTFEESEHSGGAAQCEEIGRPDRRTVRGPKVLPLDYQGLEAVGNR
jgi:hypothetical protein